LELLSETELATTVLSGELIEEISPTTPEEEGEDYDILIQGSDRKYPAIIIRRKHRGKGATIKTISKNGKYSTEYEEYGGIIEAYKIRRTGNARGRYDEDSPNNATEAWVDKTIQTVVGRPDNSKGDFD
jgi:hypothetical protein